MIHLYLLRHGECEGKGLYVGRGTDSPLTDEGKEQIQLISKRLFVELQKEEFDYLFSSKQLRALESSAIISEDHKITINEIDGLEETDFGDWEAKSYDQIMEINSNLITTWLDDPINNRPPNGESINDLKKRILPFYLQLSEMINDQKEWNIIVVSHKGPLTVLLTIFLKLGLDYFWNLKIDRGSLSKMNLYPRFSELEFLNLKS